MSRDLMLDLFIDANIHKIPLLLKPPQFSNNSRKVLTTLFEQMRTNPIIPTLHSRFIDSCRDIPKGYNYDYLPKTIRENIENMDKSCFIADFQINKRTYEIAMVYSKLSRKEIEARLGKIKRWLTIADLHAPVKCSQKMNIYIYFTDAKKILPPRGSPIDENNANTAFTTHCQKVTELNLFREEEWFKVFIHETFHNMGLDFSEYPQKDVQKKILEVFPVKCDVRLFETYCETWAEIINIMFLVFNSSNKNVMIENLVKKTEKTIYLEQMFSIFQMTKVLRFYGLSYTDLYEKTETARALRIHRYAEKTNAFSYYILKTICMYNIDGFLEFCHRNNNTTPIWFGACSLVKGEPVTHVIDEYCDFIREHYKSPEFIDDVKAFDEWTHDMYSRSRTRVKKSSDDDNLPSLMNTLRMSLFGDGGIP